MPSRSNILVLLFLTIIAAGCSDTNKTVGLTDSGLTCPESVPASTTVERSELKKIVTSIDKKERLDIKANKSKQALLNFACRTPLNPLPWYIMGQFYEGDGNRKFEMSAYEKSLEAFDNSSEPFEKSLTSFGRSLEMTFDLKIERNMKFVMMGKLVREYIKRKNYLEAEAILERAIKELGEQGAFANLMAELQHKKGNIEGAIVLYKRALDSEGTLWESEESKENQIERNRAISTWGLGIVYFDENKKLEAAEWFERSIKYWERMDRLDFLGGLYFDLARYEDAIRVFKRIKVIDPDYIKVHRRIGKVFLASGKYEKAAESVKEYLKYKPDDPIAWNDLGRSQLGLKHYPSAARALQRAVAMVPTEGVYQHNLGLAYYALGRHSDAQIAFRNAIKSNKNRKVVLDSWNYLAHASADKGDRESAIEAYEWLRKNNKAYANKFKKDHGDVMVNLQQ